MRARLSLTLAAFVLLLAGTAQAYPQFQFTSGAVRCNSCHTGPAGGGLLTDRGRNAAEEVSASGDGAFLGGKWTPPDWLLLGADVRAALLGDNAAQWDAAAIPMQLDAYARVTAGDFSLYVSAGPRGFRSPGGPAAAMVVSREHYVMWRPAAAGPYLRAGKFFAPFGLRLAEHNIWTRRYTGFADQEETYNASAGWMADGWEAHLTGFLPDPLYPVGYRESGAAGYAEVRIADRAALGAQGRLGTGNDLGRTMAGAVAKLWLPGLQLLLFSEGDYVRQRFAHISGVDRNQVAALVGGSLLPRRGWLTDLFLQVWSEDLSRKELLRQAAAVQVHWFWRAHHEVALLGQVERTSLDSAARLGGLALAQYHYYP